MYLRICVLLPLLGAALVCLKSDSPAPACCPLPPPGKPVVNSDQTVVILWDPATKTEHFIRRASFKSDADDFGFLIPTPAQPELNESGDDVFPYLKKLTEPEIQTKTRPKGSGGCLACSDNQTDFTRVGNKMEVASVAVLKEKSVAGFKAQVLEASSAEALTGWLKKNGYAYSPEVEAWAKPYVEAGWKITALKVEKAKGDTAEKKVAASSLRLSFKTDRPLFPDRRKPDPKNMASSLGATHRLLRIYFVGDARYRGDLTPEIAWNANVAWSNKLDATQRKQTLDLLKLPDTTGPAAFWLTEFEDDWPYRVAPADLYFTAGSDQSTVKRKPIIVYVSSDLPSDLMFCALGVAVFAPPLLRRFRRQEGS